MFVRRKNRAVFLDRDGVIIEDVHYLRHPDQLRLIAGAAFAIKKLHKAGFKVVVVSNQSAIARGYVTPRILETIHRRLKILLRLQGARLDVIYYCPHHPQAGRRVKCSCRKPEIGMLKAAVRKYNLDLGKSYLVGDTTTDVRTARNAGCAAVLVKTGKAGRDGVYKARPDAVCKNLAKAAAWVIKNNKNLE